ncbi:MAG: hypothetical protein R3F20_06285 [Planctomycetota bacterium]
MERRDVLRRLAALPFVFGAAACGRGGAEGETCPPVVDHLDPECLGAARDLMRERDLPALVVPVPTGRRGQWELGEVLLGAGRGFPWFDAEFGPDPELRARWARTSVELLAVMTSCVIVCLDEDRLRPRLAGEAPWLLVDRDGRILRPETLAIEDPGPELHRALTALVLGPDRKELERRGRAARERVPGEARAELAACLEGPTAEFRFGWGEDDLPRREIETLDALLRRFPFAISWCAAALLETRDRLPDENWVSALHDHLRDRIETREERPYGSLLPRFIRLEECGSYVRADTDDVEILAVSTECGLSFPRPAGGRYLEFTGRATPPG